MKNKSFQNCRFVHQAKFPCIMTTLNRLFKIEFARGRNWKRAVNRSKVYHFVFNMTYGGMFSQKISLKTITLLHLNFSCYYCFIDAKRQSEYSGLRPDTRSLVDIYLLLIGGLICLKKCSKLN